ncbi:hypothetical protein LY622_21255 [Halomonas sp. M5N1S17]|uniref:hypothetical protein n=1 Tax=Halomonas alkalisoli TaxID=2907158 RepID=UPI001F2D6A83|nr:hypothetical protein [Halomonas alkalisoli]MCE9665962.1 hypothetical protein [Halomonas alkalisoli]
MADQTPAQVKRLVKRLRKMAEQDEVTAIAALLDIARYNRPANGHEYLPTEVEQHGLVWRLARMAEAGDELAITAIASLRRKEGLS